VQIFTKRIFFFIYLSALVLSLLACSLEDKAPAADPPGNVLRIDVNFDFGIFNPISVDCSGSTYVFPFIYSFLCVPNPEGELEPDLAIAWEYNPKTFTWQIQLREDARFHNSASVTAADAVYSIRALVYNRCSSLGLQIESVTATSKYDLKVQLKQNNPLFLNVIWDLEIIPDLSRHKNLDLNDFPVGSGPFKFIEKTDNGRVILAANENYYKGRPAIDQVVFYYETNQEKSWTRLIARDTDIVGNLTVKNYEIIRQYADLFYFSKYYYNYYSILLYNTHHPLFENPMVRRAIAHAINRDYIVKNMLNGYAEVVAGPIDNRSAWYDPKLKPLAYDPYLSLEYLKKAGWTLDPDTQCQIKDGQMFEFDLLFPAGSEIDGRVARYIKLNLNEVGIRVHQKALPPDTLKERYFQNTEFDAVLIELSSNVRRLEEVLDLWITPDDAVSVTGGFADPEADRLINLIFNAKDQATKRDLFHRYVQLIAELQPGSFLFRKMSIDVISKRFVLKYPFSFDYEGCYRLQFARLKNEK